MARLVCLGTLTVLLVAAPTFGQPPPDAKAPSSDDDALVDTTKVSTAVLRPEFKWPQGITPWVAAQSLPDAQPKGEWGYTFERYAFEPSERLDIAKEWLRRDADVARLLRFWIQANVIIYDETSGRLTAEGSVKVDFQKYLLMADKLVYDKVSNALVADGNAQLKDPNGITTRADRIVASEDTRDAFVKSLSRFVGT
jgi:hypothetical protein